MGSVLIADSGSTKTQWCFISGGKKKMFNTQGISPYFLDAGGLDKILGEELVPKMPAQPDRVFYYGTGCSNPANISLVKKGLKKIFPGAEVKVEHDLAGAAKALCGDEKGIACILGTGSNSCYYNGKKVVKNSPGLGFILGDEGSGAYLGRKTLQHYLYNTFDAELADKFMHKYPHSASEFLDKVYKEPWPNRYLSRFTDFLSENRGHYMVENIIADSFNDFFFTHLYKYRETWTLPIHFTGSVAYGFRDVLAEMCSDYEITLGKVLKEPMAGLIKYHGV